MESILKIQMLIKENSFIISLAEVYLYFSD